MWLLRAVVDYAFGVEVVLDRNVLKARNYVRKFLRKCCTLKEPKVMESYDPVSTLILTRSEKEGRRRK